MQFEHVWVIWEWFCNSTNEKVPITFMSLFILLRSVVHFRVFLTFLVLQGCFFLPINICPVGFFICLLTVVLGKAGNIFWSFAIPYPHSWCKMQICTDTSKGIFAIFFYFCHFCPLQGRRKVSDIGGPTRERGTYEFGMYLKFSGEWPWQRWLFQLLEINKKSF